MMNSIGLWLGGVAAGVSIPALITIISSHSRAMRTMPKRRKPRKVRINGHPKDCSFDERYPVHLRK